MNRISVDVLYLNLPLLLHRFFIDYPYFANLGVMHNAAVLEQKGWKTAVLDAFAQEASGVTMVDEDHLVMGLPVQEFLALVGDFEPRVIVVGFSPFLHPHRKNPFFSEILAGIRETHPDVPIFLADGYFSGMHYIDYSPEKIFEYYPSVDFILRYETEKVLPELVERILKNGEMGDGRWETGKVVYGRASDIELDALPFAAWHLIDVDRYAAFLKRMAEQLSRPLLFSLSGATLPAVTSRGCVFDCIFCTKNPGASDGEKKLYRIHSLEYLERYFNWLKKQFSVEKIVFLDGLVNINTQRFTDLLKLLNRLDLHYDFPNGFRADKLRREHLELMRGRIDTVSISAESGSQRVLNEIVKKKLNIADIDAAAKICAEEKFKLLIHYIIGFPGERISEMHETINHAYRMHNEYDALPSVQFATPLPGSPLYKLCAEKKYIDNEQLEDFSLCFSHQPIVRTDTFTPEDLKRLKHALNLKTEIAETRKVIINVTYKCSNQCVFCAVGDRAKENMDTEKIIGFLDEARERGVILIDFDGGEPTIHPDIFDIIEYANYLGFERITITTNGRRLADRNFAARIVLSGITDLLISLHGHTPGIHEVLTREAGSFAETTQGIRNAVRLCPPRIDLAVNTTLTKVNYAHLPSFADLVYSLGIRKLNVQFITPFGSATADIVPDPNDVIPVLRSVIDSYRDRMKISVVNLPLCYLPDYEDFLVSDIYKGERNMIFVSGQKVNLADYLSGGRVRIERCRECVYAVVCEGVYKFKD
ncbi:MAG: radical SAM protein [bacterium]